MAYKTEGEHERNTIFVVLSALVLVILTSGHLILWRAFYACNWNITAPMWWKYGRDGRGACSFMSSLLLQTCFNLSRVLNPSGSDSRGWKLLIGTQLMFWNFDFHLGRPYTYRFSWKTCLVNLRKYLLCVFGIFFFFFL